MNFLQEVKSLKRKAFTIRLKTPSERLVSLFSQHRTECFGLCFDDPIQQKPYILVMNAFGLVLPQYSNIPLEIFLKLKILEEIHLYELTDREAKIMLENFMSCEECKPELWLKRLCGRFWSIHHKEKNPFLHGLHLLKDKEIVNSFQPKRKIGEEDEVFKKDLLFLSDCWPFIYQLLMQNEFRFSLAIANEDSLIHLLGNGIHEGKIPYQELMSNKYKEILPSLEKNKTVIIEKTPCLSMDEICENFQQFYQEIEKRIHEGKPVEVHLNQLRNHINHLFQAHGKDLLDETKDKDVEEAVVILDKYEVERVQTRGGREFKIYEAKDFRVVEEDKEVLKEVLNYVDSIARPERPYEFVRASLAQKLSE